jgi:hypothetical protein
MKKKLKLTSCPRVRKNCPKKTLPEVTFEESPFQNPITTPDISSPFDSPPESTGTPTSPSPKNSPYNYPNISPECTETERESESPAQTAAANAGEVPISISKVIITTTEIQVSLFIRYRLYHLRQ